MKPMTNCLPREAVIINSNLLFRTQYQCRLLLWRVCTADISEGGARQREDEKVGMKDWLKKSERGGGGKREAEREKEREGRRERERERERE